MRLEKEKIEKEKMEKKERQREKLEREKLEKEQLEKEKLDRKKRQWEKLEREVLEDPQKLKNYRNRNDVRVMEVNKEGNVVCPKKNMPIKVFDCERKCGYYPDCGMDESFFCNRCSYHYKCCKACKFCSRELIVKNERYIICKY